jgi:hypothetical protein
VDRLGAHQFVNLTVLLNWGSVSSPEEWRWSSYRFYLLDEARPVRVQAGPRFRLELRQRDRSTDAGIPSPALREVREGRGTHAALVMPPDQKLGPLA